MAHDTAIEVAQESSAANNRSGYGRFYDNGGDPYHISGAGVVSQLNTGSASAPDDATYITQTANGTLSAEQALSTLSTGIVKVTTGTGVLSSFSPQSNTAQPDLVTDPTTTSTSFGVIDATNLSLAITAQTTKHFITFHVPMKNSVLNALNYLNLYVDIDGGGYNALATQDGLMVFTEFTAGQVYHAGFSFLHTGLTIGNVYTYRPYWKVNTGTGTIFYGQSATVETHPQFNVFEVGLE